MGSTLDEPVVAGLTREGCLAPGRAAMRAEITGTHTGAWFGAAPTGKAFRMALHEFHCIGNGRLTHTWHLEDWFGWLCQAGAWPMQKETA